MLPISEIRQQFPSLQSGAIYFDNPGGTQIARHSLERIHEYFLTSNANYGGAFATSERTVAIVSDARKAFAAWLNAARPEEIVFGPNMTSLTLHLSRSLAHLLNPGDEIILTHLDHDANVAPWLFIAQERGATIRWVDFRAEDCTLDLDQLERLINPRTKLVAIGYASNAVGTVNDIQHAAQLAHQVGALCFVDAVQWVAHGITDVQALDCDFLTCSAYKYFGPHVGVLYGKYDLLERLTAYKVRTSSSLPPGKWETGTANFEGIAGALGALEYFQWVGEVAHRQPHKAAVSRERLLRGMQAVQSYEHLLTRHLIEGLQTVPGLKLWGITDLARLRERVSTVSFTLDGHHPQDVAKTLGNAQVYVWSGNFYALEVTTALGLEDKGGLVRIGVVHYNMVAEIERVVEQLCRIAGK